MMQNNPKAGYKSLPFFKQAEIIYDFTVQFCKVYIDKYSRTNDQMIQAARSGKQNIPEAYLQKSLEGKIKLIGVSRGSFEELLNDYIDFLRQKELVVWQKSDSEAINTRRLVFKSSLRIEDYKPYLFRPETAANAMICLINQTNRLLDQKLRWLEEKFITDGGFRENLFKKRVAFRNKQA